METKAGAGISYLRVKIGKGELCYFPYRQWG